MSARSRQRSGGGALPPAGRHERRAVVLERAVAAAELDEAAEGVRDYLNTLGILLRQFNRLHSTKNKDVSLKTMQDRQTFLVAFFHELRTQTHYRRLDPRQLSNRHVQLMMSRWLERGLSTATIHNYLSFLRTFGSWIGKPGLIRRPSYYLGENSPHAHRSMAAVEDKSWTAKKVDIESKIAEVRELDSWVGLQLELCFRFGMRPKEARHFRPHESVVDRAHASAADAAAFPEVDEFVRISRGTKGGRLRDVPLRTQAQRELLERCRRCVARGQHVAAPGKTTTQTRARFYYVVRQCGISKAELGVVAHGLRHQRANDDYGDDAGARSPVRGGDPRTPLAGAARDRAARHLGHGRREVTNCYLGPSRTIAPGLGFPDAANEASVGHESEVPTP